MRSALSSKSVRTAHSVLVAAGLCLLAAMVPAFAAPLPGGTLDPLTIPKYVQPLVIPPQMPKSADANTPVADYNIAVRQFKQQILPGGAWNVINGRTDAFPATTIWSYGRAEDVIPANFVAPVPLNPASPLPLVGKGISFNYPAFTIENTSGVTTKVRWINDLVDPVTGTFLPHLFNVDQTLHWANPPKANCASGAANRTDCMTMMPDPYTGPVPLVTHVHGAHVQPDSDGYPEAWWLPGAPGTKGIPASYAQHGTVYTQADNANTVPGSAFYRYLNSQPATTLWYHDHALGMTRLNVYAGPAGFWLIRGGAYDTLANVLPGPAPAGSGDPNFDSAYRSTIREVPVAIQDRSFNADGSLFYPSDRTFFDGFMGPYIGNPAGTPAGPSDMSAIWNPEAFFNTMVVNGTTWPRFDVDPVRYRLRLLNGCNSRTLNLSLFVVTGPGLDGIMGTADDVLGAEVPIYQIGADQGFLPKVVKIETGLVTTLPGNGTTPAAVAAADPRQALLMGPAERADVIVDFTGIAANTRIRMINTAPDAPFGGFPVAPFLPGDLADPDTTGQIMDFIVKNSSPTDPSTPVTTLNLPAESGLGAATNTRQVSLNEMVSDQVCVEINPNTGAMTTLFSAPANTPGFAATCLATPPSVAGNIVDLAGPRQAQLGVVTAGAGGSLVAVPKMWSDAITETPLLNSTETWEIFNTTMDAHPIHLHLVRFEVIERQDIDPVTLLPVANTITTARPTELGYKDTVVAYPGQVTRIKARFDIAGLYVWHCHIVEHEDNEMMRPMVVIDPAGPVSGITTTTAAGSYKAGSVITVLVGFSNPVTTSGLTILLNSGASISTGPLTNASLFSGSYTVAAGQNSAGLNASLITGSVTDFAGNTFVNPAVPAGANIADTAAIVVDTIAPTLTVTAPADAAQVNSTPVAVAGTASDLNGLQSVTVSVNNGIPATVSVGAGGAFTSSAALKAGANTITVVATDLAGNTTSVVRTVTLDTVVPVTTASPAAGSYTGPLTVTLTTSKPAATIHYTTDGSTPSLSSPSFVGSGSFALSATTTTTYTVQFFAVDSAGNTEAVKSIVYTIHVSDLTNASVTINNGAQFSKTPNVTLALTATDPFGVTQMQVACDGVTFGAAEPFAATRACTLAAGDGLKVVAVKFIDSLGTIYSPVSSQITLDTVVPVTTASPGAGTYGGSVNVSLAASEPATIYYTINGTTPTTASAVYTAPIQLSSATTTTINLKFFAVDRAGNAEAIQTVAYAIHANDMTLAAVSINNGALFTNTPNVLLTLAASDPMGVPQMQVACDGVTFGASEPFSATRSCQLAAGDGLKTVAVRFIDGLGTIYPQVIAQITLDTAAPVTTATPVAGTYSTSLSVLLTANETAKIYYTTNGLTPAATQANLYTGAITLVPAATTSYTLKYFAVDQAGNSEAVKSAAYTVHVSDLVGSIKINGGSPYTASTAVTLTLAAVDPAGVTQMQFSNDGVNFTPLEAYGTSKAWTLDPGEGLKTVYVRFKDGNSILYTFSANITLSPVAASATSGDLNGDNTVDIRDALQALQISIGLTTATTPELIRGDVAPLVNGVPKPDGVIDIGDALLILRRTLGLVTW